MNQQELQRGRADARQFRKEVAVMIRGDDRQAIQAMMIARLPVLFALLGSIGDLTALAEQERETIGLLTERLGN